MDSDNASRDSDSSNSNGSPTVSTAAFASLLSQRNASGNNSDLVAHAAAISQQSLLGSDVRNNSEEGAENIAMSLTPIHPGSMVASNNHSGRNSGSDAYDEDDDEAVILTDDSSYQQLTIGTPVRASREHYPSKQPRQIVKELTVEVMPALLVSVAGSVLAGYILGQIQDSRAFEAIPALFIMVPVLLNLKSNIELNMSTRLSTLANLGVLDSRAEGVRAMRSNMELLLLQATVVGVSVGLISALLSLTSATTPDGTGGVTFRAAASFLAEAAVLLAAGLGCSVVGSAVIGVLISATVAASNALGIDPDNIGTPIASSLGDMTTLLILAAATGVLGAQVFTPWPLLLSLAFLALGLVLLRVVRANEAMAHHVTEGWGPLLFAAATSSIAGVIVGRCADRFPGMPALVPVVNGIGGNIGTVFASRLSTSLHRRHARASSEHSLVMVILLLINIPIQLGFLAMHRLFDPSLAVTLWFVILYTAATVAHGAALLGIARLACSFLWSRGYDPDDYVNPFITGIGDMLGTILLSLVFVMVM